MSIFNPHNIQPRAGWCIVLADPRKTKLDSGIFLPTAETGAEKVTEGAGVLIKVGGGEKNQALGLEEGQRVVFRGFLKHANPIPNDDKWENGDSKQYFLMSVEDLIAILPKDMEVGVFSGRPSVPERR